jgi:hypothetical protein
MWQAPNQKTPPGGKKGSKSRSRRPFHIKRVTAEMRLVQGAGSLVPEAPIKVRLLLNDLSPKGVGLFSTSALQAGQEVALMLSEPSMIYLRGKVSYCQEHEANTHIIAETPFAYRMGIQLIFESPAEEEAVRKYCDDVLRELMPSAA